MKTAWLVIFALLAVQAHAATIAKDGFIIDADPNVGYTAGWAFDSGGSEIHGPDAIGMTLADWGNGDTTLWKSDGTGLDFASTGREVGGSALHPVGNNWMYSMIEGQTLVHSGLDL